MSICIHRCLERSEADPTKGLEEALVSDTLPLMGQDDGLDGRRHLVEWKSRPKHIANTRIVEARAAAKRELVEFLAFLIDAEDTDMADMMVTAGIDAAADVNLEFADIRGEIRIGEAAISCATGMARALARAQ
jgi:hypothetical protein